MRTVSGLSVCVCVLCLCWSNLVTILIPTETDKLIEVPFWPFVCDSVGPRV